MDVGGSPLALYRLVRAQTREIISFVFDTHTLVLLGFIDMSCDFSFLLYLVWVIWGWWVRSRDGIVVWWWLIFRFAWSDEEGRDRTHVFKNICHWRRHCHRDLHCLFRGNQVSNSKRPSSVSHPGIKQLAECISYESMSSSLTRTLAILLRRHLHKLRGLVF